VLGGLAGLVVAAMALPLVYLVVRSFEGGWEEVAEVVLDGETLAVLGRSALLAGVVTAASVAISVPLAWLTGRTDLPGRKAWAVLAALPLVIPSYVGGFVLVSVLGPRGMLQGWLEPWASSGCRRSTASLAPRWRSRSSPTLRLLTVRGALRGVDPAMEEAARSLGSGAWATFARVTLPQLRPGIVAGALLVALYCLSDFGVVSLLQYESFSNEIYVQYRSAFDRTPAAILALMLVALTVAVLLVEGRTRGRARYHGSAASRPAVTVALGRWRLPALLFCGAGRPVRARGPRRRARVLARARPGRGRTAAAPVERGLELRVRLGAGGGGDGACGAAGGDPVGEVQGEGLGLVEKATYLGYALPGIVLALSLVFFGANYAPWAYQTLGLLVFAYAIHFLPQAVGSTRSALLQVKPSVEEAARGLGRGPARVAATVTAPLAGSGILAGAALVFLTTMKELPATLLLGPTGFETLATRIWGATSEAFFARAAAPALLLVAISAVPLYLLVIREGAK
jgi:iron(III) transport system permease protein